MVMATTMMAIMTAFHVTWRQKIQNGGRKTGNTHISTLEWGRIEIPKAKRMFSGAASATHLLPKLPHVARPQKIQNDGRQTGNTYIAALEWGRSKIPKAKHTFSSTVDVPSFCGCYVYAFVRNSICLPSRCIRNNFQWAGTKYYYGMYPLLSSISNATVIFIPWSVQVIGPTVHEYCCVIVPVIRQYGPPRLQVYTVHWRVRQRAFCPSTWPLRVSSSQTNWLHIGKRCSFCPRSADQKSSVTCTMCDRHLCGTHANKTVKIVCSECNAK